MSALSTSGKLDENSSDESRPVSPIVRLLCLTEQGLVLESRRRFDVGIFIDLGLHLPGRNLGCRREATASFLSLEGFVVDCQTKLNGNSDAYYQITVLFSDLDSEGRQILRDLGEEVTREISLGSELHRNESVLQRLENGLGLN